MDVDLYHLSRVAFVSFLHYKNTVLYSVGRKSLMPTATLPTLKQCGLEDRVVT